MPGTRSVSVAIAALVLAIAGCTTITAPAAPTAGTPAATTAASFPIESSVPPSFDVPSEEPPIGASTEPQPEETTPLGATTDPGGGPTRTRRPRATPTPTDATVAMPDLAIDDVAIARATATTLEITIYLTNYGTAAAGPFSVSLGYGGDAGGGGFKPAEVAGLAPDESTSIVRTTSDLAPGNYTFTAELDSLGQVPESNEDNNTKEEAGVVDAPLPDLQLTSLSFPQTMTVGQEASGAFYVKNVGPGDITSPFSVGYGYSAPNGGGAGSEQIESLLAGEQNFVSVKITPDDAGSYTINLFADSGDDVSESDEANNEASYTVSAE